MYPICVGSRWISPSALRRRTRRTTCQRARCRCPPSTRCSALSSSSPAASGSSSSRRTALSRSSGQSTACVGHATSLPDALRTLLPHRLLLGIHPQEERLSAGLQVSLQHVLVTQPLYQVLCALLFLTGCFWVFILNKNGSQQVFRSVVSKC